MQTLLSTIKFILKFLINFISYCDIWIWYQFIVGLHVLCTFAVVLSSKYLSNFSVMWCPWIEMLAVMY